MQPILKVIGFFIGLFAIINGIWIVITPPYGDEPQGYVIIIAGCIVLFFIIFFTIADVMRERKEKECW